MRIAFEKGLKGKGKTRPNPIVGALVVKNGKIISCGAHLRAGREHAEVIALKKASQRAKGADLYVTLEPCSTVGKTGACTDFIINSGIERVFIGTLDPNPKHNGNAVRILKKKGVQVRVGFLESLIKDSNRIFYKYITKHLPFVTVKLAQSLDGKIATSAGNSKWITSERSRKVSHLLRKDYDAVITGINTVLADNPGFKEALLKVVVDSRLRIKNNAKIFAGNKLIIATTKFAAEKKLAQLRNKCEILICPTLNSKVDLRYLLKELARRQISSVLVESGSELVGSFFSQKLVDRVLFFIAPKIIGGKEALSSVGGKGIKNLDEASNLRDLEVSRIGEDILIEGYV